MNDENSADLFQDQFQKYAAAYLSAYNQYLHAKAMADQLKEESDAAEQAVIGFARDIGMSHSKTEVTLPGLGKFSIKQEFYGQVTQENMGKVYGFFKDQKREQEFFQMTVRKSPLNQYIREKVKEKREEVSDLSGPIRPDLPEGLECYTKTSVSITSRNAEFKL